MQYLCLAYGSAGDWEQLSKSEQGELLKQDEFIRERGAAMGAVRPEQVVTVRAWDGTPEVSQGSFSSLERPLAGFSVIEASSVEEVVQLVAKTPCARAKGAIEIRPLLVVSGLA
jgi:hypothetical protein